MFDLNVCITGGSGFIGQNLIHELLTTICKVVNYDLQAPLHHFGDKVTYVCGDVRDEKHLKEVLQNNDIQILIHLAAISTIQHGEENKHITHSVNVEGTRSVLNAAADYGKLHLLVYASTDKVYGKMLWNAYREDHPLQPLTSSYDQTKAVADALVREYARCKGLPAIVLRFCNVYGPSDLSPTRIIPRSIRTLLYEHGSCTLRKYEDDYGNLHEFYRDFIYVKDLCCAIADIIKAHEDHETTTFSTYYGEAFNLGGEICLPMTRVLEVIHNACDVRRSVITEVQHSIPEIRVQRTDCTKAKKAFGFLPQTPFEEGIALTVKYWKENSKK